MIEFTRMIPKFQSHITWSSLSFSDWNNYAHLYCPKCVLLFKKKDRFFLAWFSTCAYACMHTTVFLCIESYAPEALLCLEMGGFFFYIIIVYWLYQFLWFKSWFLPKHSWVQERNHWTRSKDKTKWKSAHIMVPSIVTRSWHALCWDSCQSSLMRKSSGIINCYHWNQVVCFKKATPFPRII